jgi:dTDP-4-amino-4,6-dideoxygalactose transaminase
MPKAGKSMKFIDLGKQRERLEPSLSRAIADVVESGWYIGGPKVQEVEGKLKTFCGARHCVSCANGTDALLLVLMAWDIGPGDAVFVPAFTFAAAAATVVRLNAVPVFVDVFPDSFNMDPRSLAAAIGSARDAGLKPRAVVPVDLFGQPADYPALESIADAENVLVLCDAAQSFGASLGNRKIGTFGHATTTSFYPSKPLGCYGDGGAIFTDSDALADQLRSLREHGQGQHRYEHLHAGLNSRLDALQAAVLIEKLKVFSEELRLRQQVADRYSQALGVQFAVPALKSGATSSWAQYTLRVSQRDALAEALRAQGVPTAIHYPLPLTKQPAYERFPSGAGGTPVAEELAETVISLPMHAYLDAADQEAVIDAVMQAGGGRSRKAVPGRRA